MLKNPIPKVTNQLQQRAIGIINGKFTPHVSEQLNRGFLIDNKGEKIETVILGKALSLLKKHIDLKKSYYWIVYPKNKNTQNLHLQVAGICDPYQLNDLPNDSYILMGHSLGALIALLYEGNKPTVQLEENCDSALKDFAVTNLSKLLQCQLSEIPFPKKNNTNKASAIIGFNSFGSLVWPKENSTGIKTPTLLIGGTYDLITPLVNEQFRVFSALNNPLNRFLIIQGASHFSPIRINKSYEENNDLFKISESFIGSKPILVQDLSTKFIVEFLKNIKDQKIPNVVKNQRDLGLDFHLLDLETIKEISEN